MFHKRSENSMKDARRHAAVNSRNTIGTRSMCVFLDGRIGRQLFDIEHHQCSSSSSSSSSVAPMGRTSEWIFHRGRRAKSETSGTRYPATRRRHWRRPATATRDSAGIGRRYHLSTRWLHGCCCKMREMHVVVRDRQRQDDCRGLRHTAASATASVMGWLHFLA